MINFDYGRTIESRLRYSNYNTDDRKTEKQSKEQTNLMEEDSVSNLKDVDQLEQRNLASNQISHYTLVKGIQQPWRWYEKQDFIKTKKRIKQKGYYPRLLKYHVGQTNIQQDQLQAL